MIDCLAIFPKGLPRAGLVETVRQKLVALPNDRAYKIIAQEFRATRSNEQNRLLWALYEDIIRLGGEAMQGWEKEDLHDFFLCNHFGTEVKEMFGKKKQVPLRTSSGLSKTEFSDYVESIVRFMAERGVVLKLPGDLT